MRLRLVVAIGAIFTVGGLSPALADDRPPTDQADAAPTVQPVDPYITEGSHTVNGRQWSTLCEPYSQTHRCRTDIWATTVTFEDNQYKVSTGWAFNNLTYVGSMSRADWGANPLANSGAWTGPDGREWRTECDTAATGGNGCRTWVKASFIDSQVIDGTRTYSWTTGWLLNNMVRFQQMPNLQQLPTPGS
ncbi:hypothetical protein [Tessaracoccus massiliensis]|uniref:hypothetical protein n=1 Tax=Tessaracoccus massiliensis TaxID=1522311 RepID=UPI001117C794|nr:hypothetical protein [Tessaracoccus massiliensis]